MILKNELIKIVKSQKNNLKIRDHGIMRSDLKKIRPEKNFAIFISGIRRCGKSTLMLQSMNTEKNYVYLNFEDPRLTDLTVKDFEILEDVFNQEFGENEIYYFDEIQSLSGWESYIRYLLDNQKRIIITGSNASLLNREMGSKLTGRNIRLELFPFSFKEYSDYLGIFESKESFSEYLLKGGFPEYLRTGMDEILQNLLIDIVARDIVSRYNIKNSTVIMEMAVYLLSNISCEMTLSGLKKIFTVIGSVTTLGSYLGYLEDAYLIFTLSRFSYSQKSRQINPKKVYGIDNGFICANTAGFSENKGQLLENYVYLELRKRYHELYYFRELRECDFLVKEKTKISKAIQVCYEVNNRNKDREITGLIEVMEKFELAEGCILTSEQEDSVIIDNKKIRLIPAWKYFQ